MKKACSTVLFFILTVSFSFAQSGIDAVAISKTYYNSIVKILLYDSVMAKKNPAKAYIGRGSGFIVTDNGYIFTNRHVINMCEGYYRYTVYNPDTKSDEEGVEVYTPAALKDASLKKITYAGRAAAIVQIYDNENGGGYSLYYARVVAVDTADFDGAIIQIVSDLNGHPINDNVKFHPVPIGNSDSATQGQDICLYGFPAQYNGTFDQMLKDLSTLMFGKHSGLDFFQNPVYGFIKTDAVINSGNSGGPAFGPGNKVIGLATAAFDKTNTGLIGGINAMYDLAAQVPGLQQTLAAKGLSPAQKRPAQPTGSIFKPRPMPTKAMLRHANNSAAKASVVTNFMLIDLMLKAGFGGQMTCKQPAPAVGSFACATGTYSIPFVFDGGPSFRFMFPSIVRFGNNMLGLLVSGSFQTVTYSYKNIPLTYTDSANNVFQAHMYNDKPLNTVYVSAFAGLSYTYVFGPRTSLSAFFGMGIRTDESRQVGEMDIYYPPSVQNPGGMSITNYIELAKQGSTGLNNQVMGLIFRFRHLALGMEYSMIKDENISFTCGLPRSLPVTATLTNRNSINITLGIAIRPKGKNG